jgi:hypothetical protein
MIFNKLRHFFSIYSMSITNCKKMSSPILSQVRHGQKAVLVNLIWVTGWKPSFGGKCEFWYTVINLLTFLLSWLSTDFLGYGGSHHISEMCFTLWLGSFFWLTLSMFMCLFNRHGCFNRLLIDLSIKLIRSMRSRMISFLSWIFFRIYTRYLFIILTLLFFSSFYSCQVWLVVKFS